MVESSLKIEIHNHLHWWNSKNADLDPISWHPISWGSHILTKTPHKLVPHKLDPHCIYKKFNAAVGYGFMIVPDQTRLDWIV